jgi:hypothetical protein
MASSIRYLWIVHNRHHEFVSTPTVAPDDGVEARRGAGKMRNLAIATENGRGMKSIAPTKRV